MLIVRRHHPHVPSPTVLFQQYRNLSKKSASTTLAGATHATTSATCLFPGGSPVPLRLGGMLFVLFSIKKVSTKRMLQGARVMPGSKTKLLLDELGTHFSSITSQKQTSPP